MSRIAQRFDQLKASGRKALIPYLMSGDPDQASTVSLMHALVEGGADMLELGFPFSDPMADGPTIQRAAERALLQGGSLRACLEHVRVFRQQDAQTPVVLMGYANPVESMGLEQFAEAVAKAGVDGVLIVDYPPEAAAPLSELLRVRDIDMIFLLAPTTTDERVAEVARCARGYVYYVSLKGVTGSGQLDVNEVSQRLEALRQHLGLPVGVGFGIRDPQTAGQLARVADAVIVGSRLIEEIESAGPSHCVERARNLVNALRRGIDEAA